MRQARPGSWRLQYQYQYGFAQETSLALAARTSYGLWVTLDHPQAPVRTLRRVWRAPAHAERPELWLVAVGVLVRLGASLECCSEGASFWDDLDDPVRTIPLR